MTLFTGKFVGEWATRDGSSNDNNDSGYGDNNSGLKVHAGA